MPMDLAVIRLIGLLTREVVYLYPGRNTWPVPQLQASLESLRPSVENVDSAEGMDEESKRKHEDAIEIFHKGEDLTDTFLSMIDGQRRRRSIMRHAIIFNNWRVQRKLLREALDLRKELNRVRSEVPDESKHNEIMPHSQSLQRSPGRPDGMMIDDSEIVGFGEDSKTLEEQLIIKGTEDFHPRNALCVVSITGKPGSGKTTLARKLYNSTAIKNHFQVRVWVVASPDLSPTDLLLSILKAIIRETASSGNTEWCRRETDGWMPDTPKHIPADSGARSYAFVDYEERRSREENAIPNDELLLEIMMKAVRKSLRDRRFLIVLDDMRDPKVWLLIFLENAFPNNRNGSRVMITTRDSNWGSFIHQLEPLNEEATWQLFLKKWGGSNKWGGSEEDDSKSGQLKERIYEKTRGLPLAIVVLGGLLSRIAHSLPELWELTENHQFWSSIRNEFDDLLKKIYTDLPHELKPFFLYVGIFPREFQIPVRRLCGLWSAEGYQNLNDPDLMIKELSKRNLIEVKRRPDGTPKTCRMSATIHAFAVEKAEEVRHHRIHSSTQSLQPPERDVRRLAEWVDTSGTAGNPSSKVGRFRYLRSYLSFNFQKGDTPEEQAGKLIHEIVRTNRGFGLLRVLDLERVYKPSLPESIGKLFNLRYLGLRWTFIDTLPSSVGDLTCLETLDVKHTLVTHLPPSLWRTRQLRHLYLSDTLLDRVPRKSLAKLETLWGLVVDEESYLTDVLKNFTNLTKLGLTCRRRSGSQGALSKWTPELKRLRSLRLRSLDRSGQPSDLSWLNSFSTDHSNLSNLSDLSDLYLTGRIGRLPKPKEFPPNLKMLTLSASNLEEDPMPTLGQLSRLKILRLLGNAYKGRSMCCHHGFFYQLKVMKLWKQENLEKWNVQEGAMPELEELEIRLCDKLKQFPVGLTQNRQVKLDLTLTNMPEEFIKAAQDKKGNGFAVMVKEWKESSPSTEDEAT